MSLRYEFELTDGEEEEGFDLSRTKPKYSTILQEEEYETEGDLPGFDKGPEENYGGGTTITTWDPWEPSYFFPI